MKLSRYKRLFGVILFLGVLFAVFELTGLREHFSLDYLRHQIDMNRAGGLLLFIVLFSLGNLIQIPGWIFLAAAVLALGQFTGGLVTYAAAMFSCMLTFLLIRFLGGDALRQLDSKLAAKLLGQLDRYPVGSVALLRILFQTMPALNYALALSGVKFRQYLAGTAIGLPLPITLYCVFFDYLAHVSGLG